MIPRSTRAAVLTRHSTALDMQYLPLPEVIGPGAALVQIVCATLCGTDIEIWQGKMSFPGMLPMVLGHEMIGEIVAVGEGTTDALGSVLAVGERIGWSESTCGKCYGCVVLREPVACENRGYGFLQRSDKPPFATAGLADYAYVTPGAAKLRIPEEVKDTWASMAGCAAKTVLRSIDRVGGIRAGSTVVIQGSGALGIFATAAAKLSGAAKVITVGAPVARLEMARKFGADAIVNIEAGSDATIATVNELTGRRGADYVFDFAGAATVGREAAHMAGQRGKVVIVGSTGPAETPVPLGTIMGKELTVVGSLNGDISDYARAIDFFKSFARAMPWDLLFSEPVGLSTASKCIDAMCSHQSIKAVIDPRIS